jgi:hypothetical protein
MKQSRSLLILLQTITAIASRATTAAPLRAGVAKVDITSRQTARVNDPCFAKVLVLSEGDVTAVLAVVDAVAIGGIGAIRDTFMDSLRHELGKDPGIPPSQVIVNASHCHGLVRGDADSSSFRP